MQLIYELLSDFLEPDILGTTYEIQGVCEPVEDDEDQPRASIDVPTAKNFDAVVERLDALPFLLQEHLQFRTPTCAPKKPELKGRFVSIHFESDQDSPGGERPLRKLFRYRTQSSRTVEQLREYWCDFVWQAGPYIVHHKGYSWGTPAVWAASEEEGKRVIRFAATEAGFDPDTEGEWVFSSTNDPRYGMTGRMRRSMRRGAYWLTSRDGPSGFPVE